MGQELTAHCFYRPVGLDAIRPTTREHEIPCEHHNCGIHASTNAENLQAYVYDFSHIVVMVDTWGKVIVHERGFRAEHAQVVAVIYPIPEILISPHKEKSFAMLGGVFFPELIAENSIKAATRFQLPVLNLSDALSTIEQASCDPVFDQGIQPDAGVLKYYEK